MARSPQGVSDDDDGVNRLLGELIGVSKQMQLQVESLGRDADARARDQKTDLLRTEDKLSEQVRAIREAQYHNASTLQSGIDQLSSKLRNLEEKNVAIEKKVDESKRLIDKNTSWQARLAGGLAVATVVGGVVWWVMQQLITFWISKN